MNWLNVQQEKWCPPLRFASQFHTQDMALLYSGMREQQSGEKSFLFLEPLEVLEGNTWDAIPSSHAQDSLPDWVGYISYETTPPETAVAPASIPLPVVRFTRYAYMFVFDHVAQQIDYYCRSHKPLAFITPRETLNAAPPSIRSIASNFTRASYESSVQNTVNAIHAGEFYQANLTRKFYGEYVAAPQPFGLFTRLAEISPAPFSAYIRQGNVAILSSSPESFLKIDADGRVITRPIKGSARRGATLEEDNAIRDALIHSPKNQAENLMIVDLMRNDLARVSMPDSVKVSEQSGLHSYATIHHLISTVEGVRRPDASLAETIAACFPPGSMTGAPKIAAMRWCAEQEKMARGVYSGAIGWLNNNSCDLSVVIRTLVMARERFEFQVGGGIVADSTPEDEWRETLIKARGIAKALGIEEEKLAAL